VLFTASQINRGIRAQPNAPLGHISVRQTDAKGSLLDGVCAILQAHPGAGGGGCQPPPPRRPLAVIPICGETERGRRPPHSLSGGLSGQLSGELSG
jgi:hypothetical protein